MKKERVFYTASTEECRNYMDELLEQCKDRVICIRDVYHDLEDPSIPVDKYQITNDDYYRIRAYIRNKKHRQLA